jgi:hypothetical protein
MVGIVTSRIAGRFFLCLFEFTDCLFLKYLGSVDKLQIQMANAK